MRADITPEAHARAIHWIQEKLVFITLSIALLSCIISTVAVTSSVMVIGRANTAMDDMADEMEVYEIYINRLDAKLRSLGIEPPPLEKDDG